MSSEFLVHKTTLGHGEFHFLTLPDYGNLRTASPFAGR